MPDEFFKVDIHYPDHPGFVALTGDAIAVFWACVAYANRLWTDGFVPEEIVRALVAKYPGRRLHHEGNDSLGELLAGRKPRLVPVPGGYEIRNYLEHNRSRGDRDKQRQQWRDRQARHRDVTRDSRMRHGRVTRQEVEVEQEQKQDPQPPVLRSPSTTSQETSEPPPVTRDSPVTAQQIVGAYIDRYGQPTRRIIGQLAKQLKESLEAGIALEHILGGLEDWHGRDQHPSTLDSFIDVRRRNGQPRATGRVQRGRQQLIDTHRALEAWARQKEAQRGRAGVDPDRGSAQRELPRPGAPARDGRAVVRGPGQLPGRRGGGSG